MRQQQVSHQEGNGDPDSRIAVGDSEIQGKGIESVRLVA